MLKVRCGINNGIHLFSRKDRRKIAFTFHCRNFFVIPGNLKHPFIEKLNGSTVVIMCFRRPAFMTLHCEECIGILQCKIRGRLSCAAQEISDIATVQLNRAFPEIAFFCSLADGFKNFFVHEKPPE